jgi:hypothetical protein
MNELVGVCQLLEWPVTVVNPQNAPIAYELAYVQPESVRTSSRRRCLSEISQSELKQINHQATEYRK